MLVVQQCLGTRGFLLQRFPFGRSGTVRDEVGVQVECTLLFQMALYDFLSATRFASLVFTLPIQALVTRCPFCFSFP